MVEPITATLDLDAIEALADEATPGPWLRVETREGSDTVLLPDGAGLALGSDGCRATFDPPDAEFVAQSRTIVPALVAEVRRLTSALSEARESKRHWFREWEREGARRLAGEAALREVETLRDDYRQSIDALAVEGRDVSVAVAETERRLTEILTRAKMTVTDIDLDAIEARAVAAMRVLDGDDLDAPIRDVDEMVHDQIALVAEVRRLTAALSRANDAAVAAYDGNGLIQQANADRDTALDVLREITEAVIDGHDVSRTVRDILECEGLIPKPVTLSLTAMRVALWDSLVAALDDAADDKYDAIAEIVATLQDRRDAQEVLRAIPKVFGARVFGRVLLFHMQARTPLAGDAESVTPLRTSTVEGLTIADLGWPADVLRACYQVDAAAWNPDDRARFDAAVQAWRDAHPEARSS